MNRNLQLFAFVFLAGASIAFTGCSSDKAAMTPEETKALASAAPATNTQCPISGDKVDPKDPDAPRAAYNGKTYVFCCDDCKEEFQKDPRKALDKK